MSMDRSLTRLLALAALALAGCETTPSPGVDAGGPNADASPVGEDGPTTADALAALDAPPSVDARATGAVTIAFEHLVAGAPVTLGTDTPYTNAAGNAFGVTRLHYFVSDVTLHMDDGTTIAAAGAHYVDHESPGTRSLALPEAAPVGPIASISFVMGLPPALNVTGAFTSPPESLMEWPVMMGGGYHHMKFEGRYVDDEAALFNFMVHSGGLNGVDYSFEVVLDASGHTVAADGTTLTVQMNLDDWLTTPNDWDLNDYFNATHRGIMGDAAAQASLRENGAGVFTLGAP